MDIGTVFCGLTNTMLDVSLPTFVPKLMWRIVIINLYFCELKRRSNRFTLLFCKEDFCVLLCSIHEYVCMYVCVCVYISQRDYGHSTTSLHV